MARRYIKSVKESVCKQILYGELSVYEIAKKNNIPYSTVSTWKRKLFKAKGIKNNGFSAEEKLDILIITSGMSEQEVSEFCRKKGMYPHMLEEWKKEFIENMKPSKREDKEKKLLRKENKKLRKELRRKEKALAEATALLILKKKAEALWGEEEDDI